MIGGGPQDSPCETRLSTQESEAAQQLASPQPINPFFLEGGEKMTRLSDTSASGCCICWDAALQSNNAVLQLTLLHYGVLCVFADHYHGPSPAETFRFQ